MLCVQFLFWYIAHNWNYGILATPARTIAKTRLNVLEFDENFTYVAVEILTQTDSTCPLARLLYLTDFRLDSSKELITDLVCEAL